MINKTLFHHNYIFYNDYSLAPLAYTLNTEVVSLALWLIIALSVALVFYSSWISTQSLLNPAKPDLIQKDDSKRGRNTMNLQFRNIYIAGDTNKLFVFDTRDHSGATLIGLVWGKASSMHTEQNVTGILLHPSVIRVKLGQVIARFSALTPCAVATETNNTILSNNAPIAIITTGRGNYLYAVIQ